MSIDYPLLMSAAESLVNSPDLGQFDSAEIHVQNVDEYVLKVVLESKPKINYLELLAKYVSYIIHKEGMSYVKYFDNEDCMSDSPVQFTEEEIDALKELE